MFLGESNRGRAEALDALQWIPLRLDLQLAEDFSELPLLIEVAIIDPTVSFFIASSPTAFQAVPMRPLSIGSRDASGRRRTQRGAHLVAERPGELDASF